MWIPIRNGEDGRGKTDVKFAKSDYDQAKLVQTHHRNQRIIIKPNYNNRKRKYLFNTRRGAVVSTVGLINKVNQRWARLAL